MKIVASSKSRGILPSKPNGTLKSQKLHQSPHLHSFVDKQMLQQHQSCSCRVLMRKSVKRKERISKGGGGIVVVDDVEVIV
jgi:hypothetical protein